MRKWPQYFPPEAIEDYKKLFPVALEAAKAVGKMMHRWAREISRQKYNMASYEEPDTVWYGLEMLKAAAKGKGPTPHQYIPNYLTKEEIEKIHVAQRVLAELLGLHSRVMFEKGRKSGVDMFLDENRMEELEQEVQRILRGEHLKEILGEKEKGAHSTEEKPESEQDEVIRLMKEIMKTRGIDDPIAAHFAAVRELYLLKKQKESKGKTEH